MPILARHRWLYPIDWRELSASIRFRRARGRCEGCGRPHGREVIQLGDGLWWDEDRGAWRYGAGKRLRRMSPPHSTIMPMRRTRVVLSTCHLDHDSTNNNPRNLAALCQRCHILNDAPEHWRQRAETVRARRALGDLFTGPYGCISQGDTPGAIEYELAMPAKHTLHVALTEPLVQYVRNQVATGRHVNASDTVRHALELLIERDMAATDGMLLRSANALARHHG